MWPRVPRYLFFFVSLLSLHPFSLSLKLSTRIPVSFFVFVVDRPFDSNLLLRFLNSSSQSMNRWGIRGFSLRIDRERGIKLIEPSRFDEIFRYANRGGRWLLPRRYQVRVLPISLFFFLEFLNRWDLGFCVCAIPQCLWSPWIGASFLKGKEAEGATNAACYRALGRHRGLSQAPSRAPLTVPRTTMTAPPGGGGVGGGARCRRGSRWVLGPWRIWEIKP